MSTLSLTSSRSMPMAEIYQSVAESFAATGNRKPSHCDVRCAVNDALDALDRDGFKVHHEYSQDRAFSTVRNLLK